MKPLGYYSTSEAQITELELLFGSQLQGLNRLDTVQLQLTLAVYVACWEVDQSATLQTAVDETPLDAYSDDAFKAIETLEGTSIDGIQGLLVAVANILAYEPTRK